MRSLSWLQLTYPSVVSSWGRLCVGRKQETRCVSWPYEVLSLHSTTYVEDQQPRTQPGGEKDLITLCLCECGLPRGESFHFPTCCTPLPRSLPPSLQSPVCVVGVFLFPEHIRFLHHSTALQPSTTHAQRHGHKRQCGCISFFFILISVHAHTDTQFEYLNQEDLLRLTESVGWCHFCFVSVTTVLNHANSCCCFWSPPTPEGNISGIFSKSSCWKRVFDSEPQPMGCLSGLDTFIGLYSLKNIWTWFQLKLNESVVLSLTVSLRLCHHCQISCWVSTVVSHVSVAFITCFILVYCAFPVLLPASVLYWFLPLSFSVVLS